MKQLHANLAQNSSLPTNPAFGDNAAARIDVKMRASILNNQFLTKPDFNNPPFYGAHASDTLPPDNIVNSGKNIVELGTLKSSAKQKSQQYAGNLTFRRGISATSRPNQTQWHSVNAFGTANKMQTPRP